MPPLFWKPPMEPYAEVATVVVSTVSLIIAGTWQLGKMRDELRDTMLDQKEDIEKQIMLMRQQVGETIAAIREKTNQIELYIRDNYVRKETFDNISQSILTEIRAMTANFDSRMLRIEKEIMQYLLTGRRLPPGDELP